MHRVVWLAFLGLAGCSRPADTAAVISVAEQAAHRLALAGEPAVWSVRVVADSLDNATALSDSLRAHLGVRPRVDRDSLSHELTLLGVRSTRTTLVLHVEVATFQRCGPTWAATFGSSENALVYASRSSNDWRIDSIRPLIYGDPGICTSDLPTPAT